MPIIEGVRIAREVDGAIFEQIGVHASMIMLSDDDVSMSGRCTHHDYLRLALIRIGVPSKPNRFRS